MTLTAYENARKRRRILQLIINHYNLTKSCPTYYEILKASKLKPEDFYHHIQYLEYHHLLKVKTQKNELNLCPTKEVVL